MRASSSSSAGAGFRHPSSSPTSPPHRSARSSRARSRATSTSSRSPITAAPTRTPSSIGSLSPTVALISVGADNDYGHPRPETIAFLAGRRRGDRAHRPVRHGRALVRPRTASRSGANGPAMSRALGRLGAWLPPHDDPPRRARGAPSRSSPGVIRSPRRSSSSPVQKRCAPSVRRASCATTCAPKTRASRSPTSVPTTTSAAPCSG